MFAKPCGTSPAVGRSNDIMYLLLIFVRISSADFTHTLDYGLGLVEPTSW